MLTSQQNVANDLIREEMAKGIAFCFRIISGSMAPLIAAGDEVVVERASAARLRRGDIVLYAANGIFHTHRLLARRRRGNATLLVTKGDATLNPDQPWREKQLWGKAVAVRKGDRTIDLQDGKWRAVNRLLGILAALQVAVLRVARWVKMVIIGNRSTRLTPLMVRIVFAPSRWLLGLAGGSKWP